MFFLFVSPACMVARRSDVVALARKFHEQPQPPGVVLYLTGGCMQLVPMLLTVPGASRTVLELKVPYSQRSLRQLIDTEPTQYVSADVARQLARQAFLRAQELSGSADGTGGERCLGLGCTAALRSDPPKRGEHRYVVGIHPHPIPLRRYDSRHHPHRCCPGASSHSTPTWACGSWSSRLPRAWAAAAH